ncbi:MAG: hypothetical protein V4736_08650, partial [Bdellovibrionota bacterium]
HSPVADLVGSGAVSEIVPFLEIQGEKAYKIDPATKSLSKERAPGTYFLPDECGFGPMYLCLFRKADNGNLVT